MAKLTSMKVAIIDDDMKQARLLAFWLKPYGFDSTLFINGEFFLELPSYSTQFDLILVDWQLSDSSGLSLVKLLNQHTAHSPIIVISETHKVEDLAIALHSGADDFISKPLDKTLLLARITSTMRRYSHFICRATDHLRIDMDQQLLLYQNQSCHLSKDEVVLMSLFIHSNNLIISREELNQLINIDTRSDSASRALDLKISRLRKKLKMFSPSAGEILNQYGKGYIYRKSIDEYPVPI